MYVVSAPRAAPRLESTSTSAVVGLMDKPWGVLCFLLCSAARFSATSAQCSTNDFISRIWIVITIGSDSKAVFGLMNSTNICNSVHNSQTQTWSYELELKCTIPTHTCTTCWMRDYVAVDGFYCCIYSVTVIRQDSCMADGRMERQRKERWSDGAMPLQANPMYWFMHRPWSRLG